MSSRTRPEPQAAATSRAARRPGRGRHGAVLGVALLLVAATRVAGEERVRVGGLFDAEMWKTDDGSRLLSRNEGDAGPAAWLRLWATAEFHPRLQMFVLGSATGGKANYDDGQTDTRLEQAFLRYSFTTRAPLSIEAGQIVTPLGNFSRRYFSDVNPLVGMPDSYSLSYPLGVQVGGRASRVDFRAALVDRPFVNDRYVPETGRALRPALAVGVTPLVGFRLGGYATRGPYLGPSIQDVLPAGDGWKDFGQSVYGLDAQYSRGYFELNGDWARSSYAAPGSVRDVRGRAWFVEPKYTWSPRWFTSLRYERNDYAYIAPLGPGFWLATHTEFYDVEAGVGCRLGPETLLKVSYRKDHWMVDEGLKSFFPDGYAVSAQLSYRFDVNSWVERPR